MKQNMNLLLNLLSLTEKHNLLSESSNENKVILNVILNVSFNYDDSILASF